MFQFFLRMWSRAGRSPEQAHHRTAQGGHARGAMRAESSKELLFWHLLLPAALAPLLWWIFTATDIDRSLIAVYYDASTHAFPLRDDAFLESVMHSGLKLVVIAIALSLFGAFMFTFIVPSMLPYRRRLLWMFVGMAGATLLVSSLKQASALHCPWDLAEYGGFAPFQTLFDQLPNDTAPGRCFPGGHASGGFALMAFYFGLRDTRRAHARLLLVAGLVLGMVMGWAQMMRGAHFLSHNVWSGWLEWMFLALLYHLVPPHRNAVSA